jgi:ribbon-helix-helix protein
MSRKKISTTIYVTPEQSERLRLLHERTKVPVAVYIREGIDLVLRHYDHLLPGQLPLASAQGDDGAAGGAPGRSQHLETPLPLSAAEVKVERTAGVGKG